MKSTYHFFLREQGEPTSAKYQHCAIALAEGLRSLGHDVAANVDYWWEPCRKRHLLPRRENWNSAKAVIVTHQYVSKFGDPFRQTGQIWILIDDSDGARTPGLSKSFGHYDYVLKSHFNARLWQLPKNVIPWAFGLTERLVDAMGQNPPWATRQNKLLSNFRVPHSVRVRAHERAYPIISRKWRIDKSTIGAECPDASSDRVYWEASGRRHNPGFYRALQSVTASACFGGKFSESTFLMPSLLQRIFRRLNITKTVALQCDSYRLWESFAAGSLVVHLDFQQYGYQLPEQPVSGTHYLGFDLDNIDHSAEIFESYSDSAEEIASTGRTWALKHYSPVAVAQRLLDRIGS